jgi:hypothetical protein
MIWYLGLSDASTINVEYDVLFVSGYDFRYIGGKMGPNVEFYQGDGRSQSQYMGIKTLWRASDNTSLCAHNTWPTQGACSTAFQAWYQASAGTPPAGASSIAGFFFTTGTWHHFKQQLHRGCPIDQGGCVDNAYVNVWGPTSDVDNTPSLILNWTPTLASGEPNSDSHLYTPMFSFGTWFGGNVPDNANATVAGSKQLYDNIRIWSGTGP